MVYQKRASNESTVSISGKKFKDNLVEKAGGESQFNFLVISFCEKIQNDKALRLFYGGLEMDSLIALQKNMILSAILDVSADETEALRAKTILRYHLMSQQGFRGKHFELLETHFADAMLDVWLDEDVMKLFAKYFRSLRSIFDECNNRAQASLHDEDVMMEQVITSFSSSTLSDELQSAQ